MRILWVLLMFGGIAIAIMTNHPGILGFGLLLAVVSGFCAVFAFAAARIESTARPDSALLTPEVLAAVRARAAQQRSAAAPGQQPPAPAVRPLPPPPPSSPQSRS